MQSGGVGGRSKDKAPADRPARERASMTRSEAVSDGRLEIQLEIQEGSVLDRVPMRTAVLRFKNASDKPLRLYLPQSEAFRANISSLILAPEGAPPLFVPEPRPHGYVVTEKDFPLLKPGEGRAFTQRFTIDPFARGGRTERRAGFEPGKKVPVSWTYENAIRQWKGGQRTLDGPTGELFGGKEIPFIWTGKLTAKASWTAPPK